ncbi:ABC transporter, ATP-binding protein [Streptococcus oralis]|uniref:ABC transporter, ATP-binding protein n=1 Tax=Streptococcus oralis TaxID=1303 RepID=A0A139PIV3_STROR|nr:ABC transporter, ATP-binding protein [Streptococcus oralis]
MFWNLVRYEFKNVNKWFLALYAAVLSLSVIIGIQGSSLSSTYYQDKGVVMLVFLSLVFGGLVITLSISTLILIIQRFKGSVYDRRGYLTLTLPVSEHQILSAKLLGAFVWSLTSTLVFLFSLYIIIVMVDPGAYLSTFAEYILKNYQDNFWLALISYIFNTLAGILCIYLSISIGQLFNEYRTALAVLAYIVISIVVSYIGFFLKVDDQINTLMIVGILKNILLGTIYYLGTYYILKNKVNLQ